MDSTRPWVRGAALAMTVGVVYVVCAIAVALSPDGALYGWARNLFSGRK